MNKIILIASAIGCLLAFIPSDSWATYLEANSNNHRFVFDFGVGEQYLQLPNLSAGATKVGSTTSLASTDRPSISSLGYEFRLGYRIYNPSGSFLSDLFSQNSTVELAFSHQGGDVGSSYNHLSPEGVFDTYLWYIDGSGKIEGEGPWHVNNLQLQNKLKQNQFRLSLKGGVSYTDHPLGLVFQPSVGIVYVNGKINADSIIQYEGGTLPDLEHDKIQNNISFNDWGVVLGERAEWHSASDFIPFADIELSLLHSSTSLHAFQEAMDPPSPLSRWVTDSKSRMTYRALLALGVAYRWSHEPDAIQLSLQGGFDHWGYRPGVAMPTREGEKVHLTSNAATDKFVNLMLSVPLG